MRNKGVRPRLSSYINNKKNGKGPRLDPAYYNSEVRGLTLIRKSRAHREGRLIPVVESVALRDALRALSFISSLSPGSDASPGALMGSSFAMRSGLSNRCK